MLRNYSERLHGREATRPDVTYTFGGTVVETTVEMPVLENDPTKPREPKPDYSSVQVGMYYYDDGTFGTEVKNDHIVGVVVIPAAATPDGYVRIAPLEGSRTDIAWSDDIITISNLTAAGVTTEVRSFPNTIKDRTIYEASQGVYENTVGNIKYPYFYIELPEEIENMFYDDYIKTPSVLNPSLTLVHPEDNSIGVIPVPYLQDGSVNPDFAVEGTMTADWTSSDENMEALKNTGSNNIFKFVSGFSSGIPAGEWHVPTITEVLFMYAKLKTIVNAYKAAGYDAPFYNIYEENGEFYGYLWSGSYFGRYDSNDQNGRALDCCLSSDVSGDVASDGVGNDGGNNFGVPLATITPNTKVTEEIFRPME